MSKVAPVKHIPRTVNEVRRSKRVVPPCSRCGNRCEHLWNAAGKLYCTACIRGAR